MRRVLTLDDYIEVIDMLRDQDIPIKKIAKDFGVSTDTIYNVNKGKIITLRQLFGDIFPVRLIGVDKTAAIQKDILDGMNVQDICDKWKITLSYVYQLFNRLSREDEKQGKAQVPNEGRDANEVN